MFGISEQVSNLANTCEVELDGIYKEVDAIKNAVNTKTSTLKHNTYC